MDAYNKVIKYFSKHPFYTAMVYLSVGLSVGILLARPMDGGHPIQIATIFGGIAIIGHLLPIIFGKK